MITTLDTRLQKAAYYALEDYQGAIVAIEPKTGKVRAMVSKPILIPMNWRISGKKSMKTKTAVFY